MKLDDLLRSGKDIQWEDEPLRLSDLEKSGAKIEWEPDVMAETPPSKLQSAGRGLAQGATLGFADEIAGAAGAVKDQVQKEGLGSLYKALYNQEQYKKNRDESRENFKKAEKANPASYMAGELGGAVATSFVPGLGVGGSIAKLAKSGAKIGGIAGLGSSEGETLGELALDTGIGAGIGLAGGAALGGTGKLIKKSADKAVPALKKFAEERTFKSLGPVKKGGDEAMAKGNLREIGRQLLDEKIVTPLASREKIAERLSSKIDDRVSQLDNLLEEISTGKGLSPEQRMVVDQSKFVPTNAAKELKEALRKQYSHVPGAILKSREEMIDTWLEKDRPMTAKEAQDFKRQVQDWIMDGSYWKANPNASQEALMSVRRAIKEGIEKNADAVANVTHGDAGQVKAINKGLGNLLQADDVVQDRIARDAVNRTVSPSDYGSAIGGAVAGGMAAGPAGAIAGAATGLANYGARNYGNQMLGVGADKLANYLLKNPKIQSLATKNPAAFKAFVNDVARRVSEPQAKQRVPQGERE